MSRALAWAPAAILLAAAVAGDEALFTLPPVLAARVETGERSRLSVGIEPNDTDTLVTVSQSIRPFAGDVAVPLRDPTACGDPEALHVPQGFVLPRTLERLLSGENSGLGLLRHVVVFVSRQIRLEEHDSGPQDAASVLRRGRGRCSGRANLAVGLLRAAGIPARTVHGVVVERDGARWHRWGEAWLGHLGWVPFDPGVSVGAVSVRYLPMVGAADYGGRPAVRLVGLDDAGFAGLPRRDGLRVVPVGGVTVRCTAAEPEDEISVVLIEPGGHRRFRHGRGSVEFVGLMPGRYRLKWTGAAGGGAMELDLNSGGVMHISLHRGQEGVT